MGNNFNSKINVPILEGDIEKYDWITCSSYTLDDWVWDDPWYKRLTCCCVYKFC
jgi:hypothetical protein